MLEIIVAVVIALVLFKFIDEHVDLKISLKGKSTTTPRKKSEKTEKKKDNPSIDDYENDELAKLNAEFAKKNHTVESNINL